MKRKLDWKGVLYEKIIIQEWWLYTWDWQFHVKNGLESLCHSLDLEISRAKSKDKQNGIGCH